MSERIIIQVMACVGAIVLTVLAFVNWRRRLLSELSPARNRAGAFSLFLLAFFWLSPWLIIALDRLLGMGRLADRLAELLWADSLVPAMIVCAMLAMALKGLARLEAVTASALMYVMWLFSWVQ